MLDLQHTPVPYSEHKVWCSCCKGVDPFVDWWTFTPCSLHQDGPCDILALCFQLQAISQISKQLWSWKNSFMATICVL